MLARAQEPRGWHNWHLEIGIGAARVFRDIDDGLTIPAFNDPAGPFWERFPCRGTMRTAKDQYPLVAGNPQQSRVPGKGRLPVHMSGPNSTGWHCMFMLTAGDLAGHP